MNSEEQKLMEQFEVKTGKHAIWRGKITKGFLQWKEKQKKKPIIKPSVKPLPTHSILNEIQLDIQNIYSKIKDLESRMKIIENKTITSLEKKKFEAISDDHFYRILRVVYNTSEKKFGDFVPIFRLTEKIKEYIPWSTEEIHSELYKLFMEYKVDLQPGKNVEGIPLVQDGKKFVWFKFK